MKLHFSDIYEQSKKSFHQIALDLFYNQATSCSVYQSYLQHLNIHPDSISSINDIPFLPISFFKTHRITTHPHSKEEKYFKSSGTTSNTQSTHYIHQLDIYHNSIVSGFTWKYGNPEDYCFIALLPSYTDNPDSSLIYMIDYLMQQSKYPESGYIQNDRDGINTLKKLNEKQIQTIVVGVSFALLDLAEEYPTPLSNLIFMETGGMKGKRKEITRQELHQTLTQSFQVESIHSEYGMCELLSQAYSTKQGLFTSPPWMKVISRPLQEPFGLQKDNKTGILKIIDLANMHSCSFIETEDMGVVYENNTFEITGRVDHSDIRGCNLMHRSL